VKSYYCDLNSFLCFTINLFILYVNLIWINLVKEIELLKSDLDEKSVLKASDFIRFRTIKSKIKSITLPEYCIFGFYPYIYRYIKDKYRPAVIDKINKKHPYYIFEKNGKKFSFIYPGVGAPQSGCFLDETISLGGKWILSFGPAGIVNESIKRGEIIIPNEAVRDEGTSFHYEEPKRYSYPSKHLTDLIEYIFASRSIDYRIGKVWTTDAPYRETPSKIKRLKCEGCLAVDMESSALFSIAKFYKKNIAALLIANDSIAANSWDADPPEHEGEKFTPEELFEISIDILSELHS